MELMVTVAVLLIIVMIVAPSFSSSIGAHRLKSVSETFTGQAHIAKFEALRTGNPVYFSVNPGAAGAACYGFNVGTACDCSAPAASQCTFS